jgi:hypothetical protein
MTDQIDSEECRHRRIRRNALLLAGFALAFYVGFIGIGFVR